MTHLNYNTEDSKQRFKLITMRDKLMKSNNTFRFGGHGAPPLKLAVQLAVNQLDQGIRLAEAVQFAAKYHNVTCAALESELSKKRPRRFR